MLCSKLLEVVINCIDAVVCMQDTVPLSVARNATPVLEALIVNSRAQRLIQLLLLIHIVFLLFCVAGFF